MAGIPLAPYYQAPNAHSEIRASSGVHSASWLGAALTEHVAEQTHARFVSVHRALRALAQRTIQSHERSAEDVVQLYGRFSTKRYARPEHALKHYALTKYSVFAVKSDGGMSE